MNPVLEFLQTHDVYSFDEGVDILLRYSPNAGVNSCIMRRRDKGLLGSELRRLAHLPRLKDLRPSQPKKAEPTETAQAVETVEKANTDGNAENEASDEEDDTVSFERHKQYDPDKLPPMLKELWTKNRDEYKELQYCHAQMKLANSDAGRADWRKKIIQHQESLKKRWQLFDEEIANMKNGNEEGEKTFNAFNARSYISKMLKKETLTDAQRLEVQKRVDLLLKNGVAITEETIEKLKDRGFSVEIVK